MRKPGVCAGPAPARLVCSPQFATSILKLFHFQFLMAKIAAVCLKNCLLRLSHYFLHYSRDPRPEHPTTAPLLVFLLTYVKTRGILSERCAYSNVFKTKTVMM